MRIPVPVSVLFWLTCLSRQRDVLWDDAFVLPRLIPTATGRDLASWVSAASLSIQLEQWAWIEEHLHVYFYYIRVKVVYFTLCVISGFTVHTNDDTRICKIQ